jgi:hypothetical protein
MLSQHEADTLAEALVVLGNLYDAAKGEAFSGVKPDEAFWLGNVRASCYAAKIAVHEVLSEASGYLDDENARKVLNADGQV